MYVIAALILGANLATVDAACVLTYGKMNPNFVEPLNPLRIRAVPDSARRSSYTPAQLNSVDVVMRSSSSSTNEEQGSSSSMTPSTEPQQKTQYLIKRSEPFARPPNRHIGFFGDMDDPDHIADLMNDADFFNQHIHPPDEPGNPDDLMHDPHPLADEPADLMGNVPGDAAGHAGGNALEGEGQHQGGAPIEDDSDNWDAFDGYDPHDYVDDPGGDHLHDYDPSNHGQVKGSGGQAGGNAAEHAQAGPSGTQAGETTMEHAEAGGKKTGVPPEGQTDDEASNYLKDKSDGGQGAHNQDSTEANQPGHQPSQGNEADSIEANPGKQAQAEPVVDQKPGSSQDLARKRPAGLDDPESSADGAQRDAQRPRLGEGDQQPTDQTGSSKQPGDSDFQQSDCDKHGKRDGLTDCRGSRQFPSGDDEEQSPSKNNNQNEGDPSKKDNGEPGDGNKDKPNEDPKPSEHEGGDGAEPEVIGEGNGNGLAEGGEAGALEHAGNTAAGAALEGAGTAASIDALAAGLGGGSALAGASQAASQLFHKGDKSDSDASSQPQSKAVDSQPPAKPGETQSHADSADSQSHSTPSDSEPVAKPAVAQPVLEPVKAQPPSNPADSQPIAQPANAQPIVKPADSQAGGPANGQPPTQSETPSTKEPDNLGQVKWSPPNPALEQLNKPLSSDGTNLADGQGSLKIPSKSGNDNNGQEASIDAATAQNIPQAGAPANGQPPRMSQSLSTKEPDDLGHVKWTPPNPALEQLKQPDSGDGSNIADGQGSLKIPPISGNENMQTKDTQPSASNGNPGEKIEQTASDNRAAGGVAGVPQQSSSGNGDDGNKQLDNLGQVKWSPQDPVVKQVNTPSQDGTNLADGQGSLKTQPPPGSGKPSHKQGQAASSNSPPGEKDKKTTATNDAAGSGGSPQQNPADLAGDGSKEPDNLGTVKWTPPKAASGTSGEAKTPDSGVADVGGNSGQDKSTQPVASNEEAASPSSPPPPPPAAEGQTSTVGQKSAGTR